MASKLDQLQAWRLRQCDGEWEHEFGVLIATLDNPGWSLKIDLEGTPLQGKLLERFEHGCNPLDDAVNSNNWVCCWVENDQFHGAGGPEMLEDLIEVFLAWAEDGPAPSAPVRSIDDLLSVMAQLRDPLAGCPWDVEQTFATIAHYTIEEAYEVADAIDRNDMVHLKDELGDLLLQVVFHSRMAEEAGHFAFNDVVEAICDKMIRRHPHVFGNEAKAEGAVAQLVAWEEIKKRERESAADADAIHSALDGVARGLPEWQRAVKLQKRAATVGFDWPHVDDVFAKLHEEIDEVRAEFAAVREAPDEHLARDRLEDELGDLLFVAANLTRHGGVDFGAALRRANAKFERRFRRMEAIAAQAETPLETLGLAQQDALWSRAKAEERAAPDNATTDTP